MRLDVVTSFSIGVLLALVPMATQALGGSQFGAPDRADAIGFVACGLGGVDQCLPEPTVIDFDNLTGLTIPMLQAGTVVPAADQLSRPGSGVQSIAGLHFASGDGVFGGDAGTPVGVVAIDGAPTGSGAQAVAPLVPGTNQLCVGSSCVIEIFFDQPVARLGIWTSDFATMSIETYDGVLVPPGDAGSFLQTSPDHYVGFLRLDADIEKVVLRSDSAQGFAIDDLMYAIPEPTTHVLLGAGIAGLVVAARRRRA